MNSLVGISVGAGMFLLFLFAHVLLWRRARRKGVLLLWGVAGAACLVVLAGTAALQPLEVTSFWAVLSLYAFLVIAYTRFYITITRTLSLRFLEELLSVPGQTIDMAAWNALFPPQRAFAARLRMLEEHRWVLRETDRYVPTTKCLIVGHGIRLLRRLYGIRRAG